MHISWSGHFTVKISTPSLSLVINPYSPEVGLSPFKATADIVALSNPSDKTMSYLKNVQNDYVLIDNPGEYSFHDATIYGTGWHDEGTPSEQIIFRFYIDDLTILYLGSLNRELTQTELQEIEQSNIDILFIPIGGSSSITTPQAVDMITTIEPNIVIPINYDLPKLNHKVDPVKDFAKEMGVSSTVTTKKFSISANKIDPDNITTVILSP
jgi:L-ascorbate metabolism protein UlaG (beta-lactamase superfamily)